MQNQIQKGKIIPLTAPTGGVVTELGYLIGSLFVVATGTVAEALEFQGAVEGVFTLPKTAAQAWTEGQKLFWDNSNHRCDTDGSVGPLIGVAAEIKTGSPTTATGAVRLNGVAPATAEGAQGAVVVLTDSTGGSGTHGDTIADGLTASAPTAITAYTALTNLTNPVTKAEGEAISAALDTLQNEVTLLQATVALCVTDLGVQNQNDSNLAQKILELRAALVAAGILTA